MNLTEIFHFKRKTIITRVAVFCIGFMRMVADKDCIGYTTCRETMLNRFSRGLHRFYRMVVAVFCMTYIRDRFFQELRIWFLRGSKFSGFIPIYLHNNKLGK